MKKKFETRPGQHNDLARSRAQTFQPEVQRTNRDIDHVISHRKGKFLYCICFHSCEIKTEMCLSYLNVILNSYFVIAKSNCPLQCPRFHISVLFIQVTVFLLHSCYKVERLTSTVPRTVLKTVLVTLHCQVFKTVAIKGVILHTVSLSGKAVLFKWTWLYCAHIWLAASIVCEKYAIQYPTGKFYRLQKRHPSEDTTERR